MRFKLALNRSNCAKLVYIFIFKMTLIFAVDNLLIWLSFVRLSLLTMTNPNHLCDVLLFVCSKMADETNLSSKLPVADGTREV